MPVLKHAKKKMRQDKKRTFRNKRIKNVFRELLKKAKQQPTAKSVSEAFSSLDKAAKNNLIHSKKAARLKSGLSKLLPAKHITSAKVSEKKKGVKNSKSHAKKTTKSVE